MTHYFSSYTVDSISLIENKFDLKYDTSLLLDQVLTAFPKLTSLTVIKFMWNISESVSQFESLSHLTVFISTFQSTSQIERLFSTFPNLENLNLISFVRKNFNFSCLGEHIKHLKIDCISFQAFNNLIQHKGHHLTHLEANLFQFNTLELNETIALVSKRCYNLKYIKIISLTKGSIKHLPKLRKVHKVVLVFPKLEISDDLIQEMLKSMFDLRSLHLDFKYSASNNTILSFCYQYSKNIENIFNSSDQYLTSKGLKFWQKLKCLKTLNNQTFLDWQQ